MMSDQSWSTHLHGIFTVILCQDSPLLSPPRPLRRAKAPPAGPPSRLNTDLPREPSPAPPDDDREE